MIFKNDQHKDFYILETTLHKDLDCCSLAVIYLLGLSEDTIKHFDEIYDTKTRLINISALNEPWQTTTSLVIMQLAFNLFNDCTMRRNKRLYSKQHFFKKN